MGILKMCEPPVLLDTFYKMFSCELFIGGGMKPGFAGLMCLGLPKDQKPKPRENNLGAQKSARGSRWRFWEKFKGHPIISDAQIKERTITILLSPEKVVKDQFRTQGAINFEDYLAGQHKKE